MIWLVKDLVSWGILPCPRTYCVVVDSSGICQLLRVEPRDGVFLATLAY